MSEDFVDLRSDTVTRPTPEMYHAMQTSPLGDDVFGDDPTIIQLQEKIADLLGKEAALFVPSGTMSNQLAIRSQTSPGDEILCEAGCHIYNYEQGGAAQLSGVTTRTLSGTFGTLTLEDFKPCVRPENEHLVRTRMVTIENTHNRGGGKIQSFDQVTEICNWAHENNLVTHMDGARLFNAVVASGISAKDWAKPFDTVSVCFSKGLGAPVGSTLIGDKDTIAKARRYRKLLGGGMRQAGVLAACASHAIDHHIDRLSEDHTRAQKLADAIADLPGLSLQPESVDTNIIIFEIEPQLGTPAQWVSYLSTQGVGMIPFGPKSIRAVTHLDIDDAGIDRAISIVQEMTHEAIDGNLPESDAGAYKV